MYNPFRNPLHFKKRWFKKKKFTWRNLLKIGLWAFGGLILLVLLVFAIYAKDLPTPEKIAKQINNQQSTQIFDRNGKLLYAFSGDQKRLSISLSEIPDSAKNATIAVEDKDFYRHHGIRFRSVVRAFLNNVLHQNRLIQGGSTITQQLVKNSLLSPKRTLSRKIKEVILAIELELLYSKDKILELYLNSIPYGSNIYGIEAASRTFFNKPAKDLTLAESATLAAMPQAPTYYSPYGSHKDDLLRRKNFVMDQMVKQNTISRQLADEAKKQTISFVARRETIIAPHFVFYVRELLADRYGEKIVNQGGLKVTTSLDLDVQKMAEQAILEGAKKLDRYGANNAAMVVIEPATGEILAMVGSRDYFNDDINGQVNVTTSLRQPGSSFKPIVYAAAFQHGYNPGKILFDLSTDFGGGYRPQNYTGQNYGPVTIREALANSLNVPAVKMLALVGLNKALETAKNLGITTLNDPNRYGLTLVLGGGEVKLLELTGAFAAFGNEGRFNPPVAIKKIEGSHGEILEEYTKAPNKQAVSVESAYLISNVLSDIEARRLVFGATPSLIIPNKTVAVKTGTTTDFHDAWTIGYTPQIATGVWVGNTDNAKMKRGADGSVVAAPIWNAFMRDYLKDKKDVTNDRPSSIQEVIVDRLSNKLPTDSSPDRIADLFINSKVPTEPDDVHVRIKINKLNGKLATDQTPKDLIEERTYYNVHSEKPDDPDWEGPVRQWAADHGLDATPPTEKDDLYSLATAKPVVTIVRPKNNENIVGEMTLEAQASAQFGIKLIEFYIDNVRVGQSIGNTLLFVMKYNSGLLKDGVHTIAATATDQNGAETTTSIVVLISNSILKPQTIQNTPAPLPSPTSPITPSPQTLPLQPQAIQ